MGMFSQKEILLMIGVVSVLLICITILTILDIKEYLKAKKGLIKEELVEDEEDSKVEPVMVMETDNTNALISEEENIKPCEEVYLEEMEDEHFEVKQEINPIIEEDEEVFIPKVDVELPQVEIKDAKVESEVLEVKQEKKRLDAFEELEEIENNLPNKKDDVTNFEAEQERTAIISLDELMARSDELYNDNEIEQYDDGDEPISIDEVIKMFKKDAPEDVIVKEEVKEVPKVYEEVVEEKVPYSKKETIPFISSVYGIEKDNALEFENTATYEKLDRENYNDFVAQLKEMNENK